MLTDFFSYRVDKIAIGRKNRNLTDRYRCATKIHYSPTNKKNKSTFLPQTCSYLFVYNTMNIQAINLKSYKY